MKVPPPEEVAKWLGVGFIALLLVLLTVIAFIIILKATIVL